MRIGFKIGFFREPEKIRRLEASGDESYGRWLGLDVDLKSIVAVIGLFCTFFTMHVTESNKITALETERDHTNHRLDVQHDELDACVKKDSYLHDLTVLQTNQVETYKLIVQIKDSK